MLTGTTAGRGALRMSGERATSALASLASRSTLIDERMLEARIEIERKFWWQG